MRYLIIGGTGTLGKTLTKKLSVDPHNEIVCYSRDELKQQEMKKLFPNVRYIIGDIRDKPALVAAMFGVDTVFHVAALKHVDVVEHNPTEAVKTNVFGTVNVAEAAMECMVSHVVFSSTDKAVLPINIYGMTKAISERYLLGLNEGQQNTKFSVYRWGNVVGSRGSVVHSFADCIKENKVVPITHQEMTRFWINIEDATDFMLKTYVHASCNDVMIPEMKASSVLELAKAVHSVIDAKNGFETAEIGIRPGEKIHECLYSSHDHCLRSDTADRYSMDELISLVKKAI